MIQARHLKHLKLRLNATERFFPHPLHGGAGLSCVNMALSELNALKSDREIFH